MGRHLDKQVGDKDGRTAYIEAACDTSAIGRSMAVRAGTKQGRRAYVKAECSTGITNGSYVPALSTGRSLARFVGPKAGRNAYVRTCCALTTSCCPPGIVLPSILTLTIEDLDFPGTCWDGTTTPMTFVAGSQPFTTWKSPTVFRSCGIFSVVKETFRFRCFDTPSGVFGMFFPFPINPAESSGCFVGATLWEGPILYSCSPFLFTIGIAGQIATCGNGRKRFTVSA